MTKITKGDTAPDFTLPTDGNGSFTLSKQDSRATVLFFYPKDDTPGCTKESIGFTEMLDEFEKLGVTIAGVSPDPVKKHDKFKAKHDLGVILISDEEKAMLEAYGVWVEKSMYGRTYWGVERTTLLIDKNLKVAEAWHKVKVAGHVEDVFDAAKQLLG